MYKTDLVIQAPVTERHTGDVQDRPDLVIQAPARERHTGDVQDRLGDTSSCNGTTHG